MCTVQNRTVSCELVGDFALVPLHVQGGTVLEEKQTLLPLSGIDTQPPVVQPVAQSVTRRLR